VLAYFALPASTRGGHLILLLAGFLFLLAWIQVGPRVAPTCRTMAMRALSANTRAVVTGTSRVERGIDPRLLTTPTVNLSSGGLSYLTLSPMIRHALERAPEVRLVVIELDVFLLKGRGLVQERLFELGVPMQEWPNSFRKRLWYVLKSGGPLSAMPRVDVEYFAQSLRPNERPPRDANGYNPYVFFRDLTAPGSDEDYGATRYVAMHRKELVGDLDGKNIEALLSLLRWLDDRGVRWMLVTLPHLPGWISGRPDAWETSVTQALHAVQAAYPAGTNYYWDASSELKLDAAHFHDGLHLNRAGVELFNRELDRRMTGLLNP
jgi:hypothetical protein